MADKIKPKDFEDLYGSFFDDMLDGLAYCQMIFTTQGQPVDFIYVKVNKNFEELTGLKDAEGKKVTELIPGINTSNPNLLETYSRVALTGKPERFEIYIEAVARWFLVSAYSPRKTFFVATFQNITDQKEIEKDLENANIAARNIREDLQVEKDALARTNAKDEAMLSSIGDGCIAVDREEKIVLINKKAAEMLRIDGSTAIGKNYADMWGVEDEQGNVVPSHKRPIQLSLAYGKMITTTTTTYWYVRKDKTKFPVALTITPIILDGKVIGVFDIFRDITQEKEVDKAKTEFVSLASHQLRTPLSEINWYTEMLLSPDVGSPLSEDQKTYVMEVASASKRMVKLVNSLLNVSRVELGTFTVEPEPFNLKEIAETCIKELEPEILKKKLKLTTKYDPSLPVILADPKLLGMVCANLLVNSVKYTPSGGQIKLTIDKRESDIMITVSDTGLGIPKEAQPRVFEKLFRADNAREVEPNGVGLGLYIVKAIIDESGGKVWFESRENKGTTFYVTLPLSGMQAKKGRKELS